MIISALNQFLIDSTMYFMFIRCALTEFTFRTHSSDQHFIGHVLAIPWSLQNYF